MIARMEAAAKQKVSIICRLRPWAETDRISIWSLPGSRSCSRPLLLTDPGRSLRFSSVLAWVHHETAGCPTSRCPPVSGWAPVSDVSPSSAAGSESSSRPQPRTVGAATSQIIPTIRRVKVRVSSYLKFINLSGIFLTPSSEHRSQTRERCCVLL